MERAPETTAEPREYIELLEDRLRQLERDIRSLEAPEDDGGDGEQRARLEDKKRAVVTNREAFEKELTRAREADPEEWDEIKPELDAAWNELREAADRVMREFERVR